MAVTYDDIISIAERLTAEGKAPTQAAIRAELGGGSFTTIGEALQQWRKLKAEEQHLQAVDIPDAYSHEIDH
ncbi:DNA-binding protein [Salmonella enterica subsp. enterica]